MEEFEVMKAQIAQLQYKVHILEKCVDILEKKVAELSGEEEG